MHQVSTGQLAAVLIVGFSLGLAVCAVVVVAVVKAANRFNPFK